MPGILCQICSQRPGTTHLTELKPDGEGGVQELHICAVCIKKLDLDLHESPPAVAEILSHKTESEEKTPISGAVSINVVTSKSSRATDHACDACGLSLSEFLNLNRFGCANDYHAFGKELETIIEQIHGSSRHVGRLPASSPGDRRERVLAERMRLEKALKQAVAEEAYEKAAKLRDQLQELDRSET